MTSLKDFPLVGFRTDLDLENSWNVTRAQQVDVRLARTGFTEVTARTTDSVYLVHAGDGQDFRRLGEGHGVSVDPASAFSLRLDVAEDEGVRAEVHILEYDTAGNRLGVASVAARREVLYLPPENVAQILVTLRIRGTAPVELHGLTFDAVPRPEKVRSGVRIVDFGEGLSGDQVDAKNDLEVFATSLRDVVAAGQRASKVLGQVQDRLVGDTAPEAEAGGGSVEARRLTRELLIQLASTLPESNGSEYFATKLPFHVAVVTDEYMLNFYRDAFEKVTYVRPAEVDSVVEAGFDLLLYVTSWKGVADEEWRGVKFREAPRAALDKLLEYARENGKPTFFQSIEDPSNFEYFLPVAEKFDHVLTSDTDCVDAYRQELGHDRVYYGEYGANALLNNPIGSYRHTLNKAFFAGSYPKRYQGRVDDMHAMFDSITSTGENLTLVDRNFGNEEYAFPSEYARLSLEPMPHDVLQRVHKLFRWSLNFNSIKSSPTMCAMRIYELQAQGRGLLSNYARSVFNRFPEIRIVAEREDLDSYFTPEIPLHELRNNEAQVRNILSARTAQDIAATMLEAAGIDSGIPREIPTVALVLDSTDATLERELQEQSYSNIILVGEDADPAALESQGVRYIGRVDAQHSYGPNFVTDRVNAFKYTDSTFVTQVAEIVDDRVEGPAHEYADAAQPGMTLYSVRKIGVQGIRALLAGETIDSGNGYAIPPFEATERDLAVSEMTVSDGLDEPVLSIIVPVYNAGKFLLTKCIPSIDRNVGSGSFEILLIDDGSTDGVTPQICRDLAASDPRIRAHCYDDGGSGSASRPRNLGIEMARAPRIAFLDPDNEISDGGYDSLLELLGEAQEKDDAVAFVSGYQVKVTEKTGTTGRHTQERLTIKTDLRADYFGRGKFPVVSTQAAVMEKRLFADGALRFVENAAGQDTLFGWELLLASGHGAFTAAAHLIYYAEREGSVTNSVDVNYFRKKLIMETAQVEVLRDHQLLDTYREKHFKNFLDNWYLPKLGGVPLEARQEAREILQQIVDLYGVDATL